MLAKYLTMEEALQEANKIISLLMDEEPLPLHVIAYLNKAKITSGEALDFDLLSE